MSTPFIQKLEHGAVLSDLDCQALERAAAHTREIAAHTDLIGEGDRPENVHLLVDGWACRYKIVENGGRQILAYLIPGDFCDLHVAILGAMDHGIATLSPCKVAFIPQQTVESLLSSHLAITRALWWATLVDEGILREWLVNMGQRPADQQLAHLFCELLVRLDSVGLAEGNSYAFPVTQAELGDSLGLSEVHVNRSLQRLRGENLITFKDRQLTIVDPERLKRFAGFDPNYLHLNKRGPSGGEEPANRWTA